MKVIIYRDKETNKIIYEDDSYNHLKQFGMTDEEIEKGVKKLNSEKKNEVAEIIELDEIAMFYRDKSHNEYAKQMQAFEIMEYTLNDLSDQINEYIQNAKKAYNIED